jgi:protease IV
VKTAPYADAGSIYRPLNENEKKMVQASVNLTYAEFKQRVADGRKIDTAFVDSIAQGRVWTGHRAKDIHLVDRFGGLNDAVKAAASMAKLSDYRLAEYPQPPSFFEQLFGKSDPMSYNAKMRAELGEENYQIYEEVKQIRAMTGTSQAKLPFRFFIH